METQEPIQPTKVPRETLEKAVTALTKWKAKNLETQKAQLLPTDEFIYLVITLNKIPQKGRTNAYKIPLPNPIYTPGEAHAHHVCLIIDDKHVPSKVAKQRLLDEGLSVDKVLKLSKLRTDYKAFESKRKLCDSYDLFFADKRVVPLLPKLIGKDFFRKKKVPVPVELGRKNWKEQIMRVCSSGLMYVGTGSCSVVKVGRVSMSEGEIVENLVAAVEGVAELVPRKWGSLRSLCVKFSDSVALPVFQRVPEFRMKIESGIGGPVEEEGKKKKGVKKEVVVSEKKKTKKGRIHEVRYMDSVETVGGDEEGESEEEKSEVEEMGSEEINGKKRKVRNGVKKGVKVVVEDVAVSDDEDEDEDDDDEEKSEIEEMESDESAQKKRKTVSREKKGSKKVKKVKEGVKGLKQKKDKGSAKAKSGSLKKSKRSRVAA